MRFQATTDILMLSWQPTWPIDHGSSLIGYQVARALTTLGATVRVSSLLPPPGDCPDDLRELSVAWPDADAHDVAELHRGWAGPLTRLRRRFAAHDGLNPTDLAGAVTLVKQHQPAAVVGIGAHSALMLRALRKLTVGQVPRHPRLVWYGADELVLHHLSCLRYESLNRWPQRLFLLAWHGLMEALFVRGVDLAVGVSPLDTAMLRHVAAARKAVLIRNGVDTRAFCPLDNQLKLTTDQAATKPTTVQRSLVFWGRLDFLPNIDAARWLANHVWPTLRWRWPDATWTIIGRNPGPEVLALEALPGIRIVADAADIRPLVRAAAVAVLPMRCGTGIKNKLLEAAALAKPIVASPRAIAGLPFHSAHKPILVCDRPAQWIASIHRLWMDAALAHRLGAEARRWVVNHHDWETAAASLLDELGLTEAIRRRDRTDQLVSRRVAA